jgi:hypothetical protein
MEPRRANSTVSVMRTSVLLLGTFLSAVISLPATVQALAASPEKAARTHSNIKPGKIARSSNRDARHRAVVIQEDCPWRDKLFLRWRCPPLSPLGAPVALGLAGPERLVSDPLRAAQPLLPAAPVHRQAAGWEIRAMQ